MLKKTAGTGILRRFERNGEPKMKEIEIFYLNGCPYCAMARKAVTALCAESPELASVSLNWIEERENAALADSRDYYYVPALYFRGEKLWEASPTDDYETILAHIRAAFERVSAG